MSKPPPPLPREEIPEVEVLQSRLARAAAFIFLLPNPSTTRAGFFALNAQCLVGI